MFSQTPNQFNEFFRQPRGVADQAIRDLWQVKSSMLSQNIPAIPKMYKYIEALYKKISERPSDNPFASVESAAIGFLDAEVVKAFIADPTDKAARDELSDQLFIVSSAIGCNDMIDPYTSSELALFVAQQLDYYTNEEMLATIWLAILGYNTLDVLPMIITIMNEQAINFGGQKPDLYTWHESLVWGMFLHLVWFYLPALQTKDQELLLKHYFYQAVVAGVPVRRNLSQMFSMGEAKEANQRWCFEVLSHSQEMVIVDTNGTQFKPMVQIWAEFAGSHLGAAYTALAEDEFARNVYGSQEGREAYIVWLRETVHTVYLLKQGTLQSAS